VRKSLFNYSFYSHPEIGNFRVWHHPAPSAPRNSSSCAACDAARMHDMVYTSIEVCNKALCKYVTKEGWFINGGYVSAALAPRHAWSWGIWQ
jgi:hypothetical protein